MPSTTVMPSQIQTIRLISTRCHHVRIWTVTGSVSDITGRLSFRGI
jgi:hypothetical protein